MNKTNTPLVLCVTNYVAMNFSANVLLAAGASPLMSSYSEEMEDLVRKSDALLINIGTLDSAFLEGAAKAAAAARRKGLKWVLDPVGAGASAARRDASIELIREFHPAIIRANASEVEALDAALSGAGTEGGRGVDSTVRSEDALEAAKRLAAASGAVVSMSGETDFITDGKKVVKVEGGSSVMPRVTAMGCAASALTAAFSAGASNPMEAARGAMEMMARAAEMAASRTSLPGSFQPEFIDAVSRLSRRPFDRKLLKLYLVTDRGLAGERDIADIVREAAAGGVTMVQLREKEIGTERFIRLAKELGSVLKPLGIPLIINDRVDVALASGADGVHIGQSDMSYEDARRILGPDRIIGLSVENMEQVLEANSLDVDYIGISPVFATPTKTDTAKPFGLKGLREAVRLSIHPTVAIGGMNAATAGNVMAAGADGIAVVSAIIAAPDPQRASAELLKICSGDPDKI